MTVYGNISDIAPGLKEAGRQVGDGLKAIAKSIDGVAEAMKKKPATYNVIVNTGAVDPDAVAKAVAEAVARTEQRAKRTGN